MMERQRIILVAPKSTSRQDDPAAAFRYDLALWNFYLPLASLGHHVAFFNTLHFGNERLEELVASFEPHLIFSIMTGDKFLVPDEPWEAIANETKRGNIRTFNWFCDDTWRFETFSSKACKYFHACSTPEKAFVDRYKEIGYNNILYATWHANSDLYTGLSLPRTHDISFAGVLRGDRQIYFDKLKEANMDMVHKKNMSFEDMIEMYSRSRIGLNLSKNSNNGKTQMKARTFEIAATTTPLLTEYHEDLEGNFLINEEILTFKTPEEMVEKAKYLHKNPDYALYVAQNGLSRFIKDHDSRVRLGNLLGQMYKL